MGLFRKRPDPIAERERALKAQISSLEQQISHLHERIEQEQSQPRLRSTALPGPENTPVSPAPPEAPAFEDVSRLGAKKAPEPEEGTDRYTELGVRKYDLVAALRRGLAWLKGTRHADSKLVNYLAAGSVHGLRPLRYEKRVARRRFFGLCLLFIAILLGLIHIYLRNR
jgi:hypothetical protein